MSANHFGDDGSDLNGGRDPEHDNDVPLLDADDAAIYVRA
jgi:hypothetical protein